MNGEGISYIADTVEPEDWIQDWAEQGIQEILEHLAPFLAFLRWCEQHPES